MKYLKLYESFDYLHSDTLKDILEFAWSYLISTKTATSFNNTKYYGQDTKWNGLLWFVYQHKAKNQSEKYALEEKYDDIAEELKKQLNSLDIVDHVSIQCHGRFIPFNPDGTVGSRKPVSITNYEVRCFLKKEYLKDITDDYNTFNRSTEVGLLDFKTFNETIVLQLEKFPEWSLKIGNRFLMWWQYTKNDKIVRY